MQSRFCPLQHPFLCSSLQKQGTVSPSPQLPTFFLACLYTGSRWEHVFSRMFPFQPSPHSRTELKYFTVRSAGGKGGSPVYGSLTRSPYPKARWEGLNKNTCSKKELHVLGISFSPFAFLSFPYSGYSDYQCGTVDRERVSVFEQI